ncbi:MAG: vitamin B12-dependent ribonucleotide reductase [Thermoplasmata archaeon]|nr:vitamin B12-dependent ribonucleotide reductase [Thermoplasmata archaeon]
MALKLSKNAITILEKRYLRRDPSGKVEETPEEMFHRVAANIASADAAYGASREEVGATERRFYRMMTDLHFLPNSPTLMNAGRELQQLSACFVLPIEDSMESIFTTLMHSALIHKSGGGTGFSFSHIRPKADVVKSTMGVSSGPISFMKVYNAATEAIKQGGTRRGANMGILAVDHPDIMDFITCKQEEKELTNFNISVGLTEEFMNALEAGTAYNLVNPRTGRVMRSLDAAEVFDRIVESAWRSGEPGIVFLDRINDNNPTPDVGRIESTNPCGEQPLLPYESCNLGSINLKAMVTDGSVDWDLLRETVRESVHFLDNVIDMNRFPLHEIEGMTRANRKIGLGVMGFADMLIKLDIPYDSEEALKVSEEVMAFISEEGTAMSRELAARRGSFPNFERSTFAGGEPVRNATITTIAPTGTISMIADVSSGIEPLFAVAFVKKVLEGEELLYVNEEFDFMSRRSGFHTEELMRTVARVGRIGEIDGIPDGVKALFKTALEIDPRWHVRVQAAFQMHTDNAVSKTINFPNGATVEDVRAAYLLAYRLGCKGITVYRDGSRTTQVLSTKAEKKGKREEEGVAGRLKPRPRPKVTVGRTLKVNSGCGNLYVTINEDEHGLCEVFATMGKSGGCAAAQTEAIARLVSLALRSGIDEESLVKQLRTIRCPKPFLGAGGMVYSCPDALAQALEEYLKEYKGIRVKRTDLLEDNGTSPECPDCSSLLVFQEGCLKCAGCGWSQCE